MSTQDVECHSPDDGKILWAVILSRSGVVLVEDDVEGPMKVVFDTPMGARHLEHSARQETLGERHVAGGGFALAAVGGALGLDAGEGREMRERRRVGRRGDDADPTPFAAVVCAFELFVRAEPPRGLGLLEAGKRGTMERSVVALQSKGIVSATRAHRCGHAQDDNAAHRR